MEYRGFERRQSRSFGYERYSCSRAKKLRAASTACRAPQQQKNRTITNWPGRSFHFRRAGMAPELPRGPYRFQCANCARGVRWQTQRNLPSALACSRSGQKRRPIRYPGNTTEKWLPTIDRCQSNIRTWSIKPRDRSPAPYSGARLSVEVSFPQQHLNMRSVRPSFGLAMRTMSSAFHELSFRAAMSAADDVSL
jgi:hypothetical protein